MSRGIEFFFIVGTVGEADYFKAVESIRLDLLDTLGSGYVIDHCISVFSKQQEETLYRMYVTDSLRLIAKNTAKLVQEGEYMTVRYADLLNRNKEKEDERTGDEIADEVIKLICI